MRRTVAPTLSVPEVKEGPLKYVRGRELDIYIQLASRKQIYLNFVNRNVKPSDENLGIAAIYQLMTNPTIS